MATLPIRCSSCGAPAAPGVTTCRYCSAPIHPGSGQPRSGAPAASRAWLPAYLAAGVMVAGGVTSAVVFNASRVGAGAGGVVAAAEEEPGFVSDLLATLSDASRREDVLVYHHNEGLYRLTRLTEQQKAPIWRAAQGFKTGQAPFVLDGEAVYVADGERLFAFALADGALRWQVGLVAEVQGRGNLRVVGGSVVAWQKDKSLQAFDPGSGALRWSRRTRRTSDQVLALGDRVIADLEDDEDKFVLVDARSGAPGKPGEVRCRSKTGPSWDLTFDDWKRVEATPDGQGAVLVLGFSSMCAARWDAATAKTAWTRDLADRFDVNYSDHDRMLVDAAGVFLAGDAGIVAIDPASGAIRDVVRDEEASFRLRLVHEGALVAVQAADYDSSKRTLVALGAADGAPRWQYRLPKVTFDFEWQVVPAPGGVVVWSSDAETGTVFAETLDIKTGQSKRRETVSEAGKIGIAPRFEKAVWGPARAWVKTGRGIFVQDLASGEITPR